MDVSFYATLRQIAGQKKVAFDLPEGATALDLLKAVAVRYPAMDELMWDAHGGLSDYIKMFVDGREIRHLQYLETPVPATAEVDIFPPAAGG